jgi:hypothetical protein
MRLVKGDRPEKSYLKCSENTRVGGTPRATSAVSTASIMGSGPQTKWHAVSATGATAG